MSTAAAMMLVEFEMLVAKGELAAAKRDYENRKEGVKKMADVEKLVAAVRQAHLELLDMEALVKRAGERAEAATAARRQYKDTVLATAVERFLDEAREGRCTLWGDVTEKKAKYGELRKAAEVMWEECREWEVVVVGAREKLRDAEDTLLASCER